MSYALQHQIEAARPALYRYAVILTRNADDALDLVQDTMLKALMGLDTYKPGSNLRAWLTTIMRNTFLTQVRLQSCRKRKVDLVEITEYSASIEPAVSSRIELDHVLDNMAGLTQEHQDVLCMMAAGYTIKQMAHAAQVEVGTIKSRMHRAKQALREASEFEG